MISPFKPEQEEWYGHYASLISVDENGNVHYRVISPKDMYKTPEEMEEENLTSHQP